MKKSPNLRIFIPALLLLVGCLPEVREVRPVGTTVTDDSRTLPPWLLPGNFAVIDLCAGASETEEELRDQLMEIKYAGFKAVLLAGAQAISSKACKKAWPKRAILTNQTMAGPLESDEKWKRMTDFAHEIGLVVLRDFQPLRHEISHEHFVSQAERFIVPDTAKVYTGPVFLRPDDTVLRDSMENRLIDQLMRTGCDGVLCYSPAFFSQDFSARLQREGKVAIGFKAAVPGSDLLFENADSGWSDLKKSNPEAIRIWLCGLPDEKPSRTAERFMLPGPAAALWAEGASAERLSFLASFNRLESEVPALNNGRTGGFPVHVGTDNDSCIVAFKRTAGSSGAIFLLNRCDFTVDFKILSPIGGMYHNTADYRLLSDFSPNRVVLQAERYTIFVRKPESSNP